LSQNKKKGLLVTFEPCLFSCRATVVQDFSTYWVAAVKTTIQQCGSMLTTSSGNETMATGNETMANVTAEATTSTSITVNF